MDALDRVKEEMSGAAGSAELQTTIDQTKTAITDKQTLLSKLQAELVVAKNNIDEVKKRFDTNSAAIGSCKARDKSNTNYKAAKWKKCGDPYGYSEIPKNSPAKDYPNNQTSDSHDRWQALINDDDVLYKKYKGIVDNNPSQIDTIQNKDIPALQAKLVELSSALQVSTMTPAEKTQYEAAQKVAEGQAKAAIAAAPIQAQAQATQMAASSKNQMFLYIGIGAALIIGVTMFFVFKGKKAPVA